MRVVILFFFLIGNTLVSGTLSIMEIEKSGDFIKVFVKGDSLYDISAISLNIKYPSESLIFDEIDNLNPKLNTSLINSNDSTIFMSWVSLSSISFTENELLFEINFRLTMGGGVIYFDTNFTEISDFLGNEIEVYYENGIIPLVTNVKETEVEHNIEVRNFPNPFNNSTKFEFSQYINNFNIYIFNVLGELIYTYINKSFNKNYFEFNAEGLSSGIYLYIINTEFEKNKFLTGKINLLK